MCYTDTKQPLRKAYESSCGQALEQNGGLNLLYEICLHKTIKIIMPNGALGNLSKYKLYEEYRTERRLLYLEGE
jgi:hypothetical protein